MAGLNEELQEEWKLTAVSKPSTSNSALRSASRVAGVRRVTIYVANIGFERLTGPLVLSVTPLRAAEPVVPDFALDKAADCWHCTFDCPAGAMQLTCTVKLEGGLFPEGSLQTIRADIEHQNAVFVQTNQVEIMKVPVVHSFFKCMWSLCSSDLLLLSAQHAQLLSVGNAYYYPPLDSCMRNYRDVAKACKGEHKDTQILTLLGLAAQYMEISDRFNHGEVAETMWELLDTSFDEDVVVKWGKDSRNLFTLRLVKWLYEFDRCAPVSSFRYTTLIPLLDLLGDEETAKLSFGLPVKNFALQKWHLPDFKVPTSRSDQADEAKDVGAAAQVAWGDLERSETLQEREVKWERSVKSAEGVLHRFWTAKNVVLHEKAWLSEMITGARHAARLKGEVPGWDLLNKCNNESLGIINGVEDSIAKIGVEKLYYAAKELAKRGRETREETKALVEKYGPYVGHDDGVSFGITTIAGMHKAPKPASVDGPLMNKKEPFAALMPSCCVTMDNGDVIFSESALHRIRIFVKRTQQVQTLLGFKGAGFVDGEAEEARLRGPGPLCKVSETEILIGDSGNACLRVMKYTGTIAGWTIRIVGGLPGARQQKDGALSAARFGGINCIEKVSVKGQPTYYIGDGDCIRRVVGGLKAGKVERVTFGKAAPIDGPSAKTGCTVMVRAMCFDPTLETLFFIDRNAVRALELSSKGTAGKIRTIMGSVNKPATTKVPKAGFDNPMGLTFTRVPRGEPLPFDAKAREDHQKVIEKADPKGLVALMAEYDRKDKLFRSTFATLVVSDTGNNCIRAVYNTGKRSQTFEAYDCQIVLGRPGSTNAWKDGIGSVSQLWGPHSLSVTEGGIMLCEAYRLRLVAPPATLARAALNYNKNQETIEELANRISDISKRHGIQTNSIIDAVRNSRLALLKGRSEAEELSYRQYANYAICEKLPNILSVIAAAPTVELLSWVTKLALQKNAVVLELDREPTVSYDTKDNDLPYNLSSVPMRPVGLLDAIENSISNIHWLPSDREQRKVLKHLVQFEDDVPGVLGPFALEKLMSSQGFRVKPCTEMFELLCRALSLPKEGCPFEPDKDLTDAISKWLTAAVPREMENEKMSNDKMIRGALKLWSEYYDSGAQKLAPIADMLFTWTMAIVTDSANAKASLYQAVGQGIVQFVEPDEEEPSLHETVIAKVLETGKQIQAGVTVSNVFKHLTEPPAGTKAEDVDLSTPERDLMYDMLAAKLSSLNVITSEAVLGDLLRTDVKDVWVMLLPWFLKTSASGNPYATCGSSWDALATLCKMAGSKFNSGCQGVRNGTLPVSVASSVVAAKSDVTAIWSGIGIKDPADVIDAVASELNTLSADIRMFEEVTHAIFDDHSISNYVSELRQKWGTLRVVDILFILRRGENGYSELERLPPVFLEAARWLHVQCGSGVFHHVWSGLSEEDVEKKIAAARVGMLDLYASIDNKDLTFTQFQKFCGALSHDSHESLPCIEKPWTESQALIQFCRICKELHWLLDKDSSNMSFPEPGTRVNTKFYSALTETVGTFRRMERLKSSSAEILQNLDYLSKLVRPSGQHTVVAERTALNSLIEQVAKFDYDELTLHSLDELSGVLSQIDDRILEVSSELLNAISTHAGLLEWLTEHASNQNFASSIEMAMGRPEMECPPELWVTEETGPGHPNEAILSQLTSVRTSLHKLLYSSPTFMRDTIGEVVSCLGHLPIYTSQSTAKALNELAPLQLALAELLSGDGDASALNRLHNLSLEEWKAEWVIAGESKASVVVMWLEYKVPRKEKVIDSKQTVAELLDYQSAVVLAKGRDEDVIHVQEFVAKFGWARELCNEFQKLKTAGHPERQGFVARVPYSLSSEQVLDEVKQAQDDYVKWEEQVDDVRVRYPLINTLMLRQLLRLSVHCSVEDPKPSFGPLAQEMRNTLFPSGPVEEVEGLLLDVWTDSAKQTAQSFVTKVDMMMSVANPAWHAFPERSMGTGIGSADLGVKLIVTDEEAVLGTVLSCYMRNGALPEWHQVLWVTPETTMEQICNLLMRWAFSASPSMYCLIGVEAMLESAYHKVTSLLIDLEPRAKNPLVVISSERDNYVVRQLAHWREATAVLPVDELRRIGDSISRKDSKVVVYTAKTAGSGKTFQIRTDAGKRKVVHVPLHKACTPGELITSIEVNKKRKSVRSDEEYVLHVDLADSVGPSVLVLLFELLILGSLYDSEKGMRWFKGTGVDIAVETAPEAAKLSIFEYLVKKESVVNKDTFRLAPEALKLGMREAFTAARADGTIVDSVVTTSLHTAYVRLSWVIWTMTMVDERVPLRPGTFRCAAPSSFTLQLNTLGMISRAANLSEPVSLWSVWAFVDVVYWMLYAAFRANQAVDPLGGTTSLLRAEAFDFMCRTAADFATRQKRVKGDDLVWLRTAQVSLATDGTVMGSVKNYYRRCQFRSHGQPVFRMGSYLDPSYIHFEDNRWVMSDTIPSKDKIAASVPGQPLLTPWKVSEGTVTLDFLTWAQLAKERPDLARNATREDGMLPITDEPLGDLKTWNEANHEALMIGRDGQMHLLAINVSALKKRMHPELLHFLEQSGGATVGANDKKPYDSLSALTGVYRDGASAAKLLGGTYCMTGDVVLKMLAVYARVRCGVPVLLMGECGCGKTHMLRYLCAWLGAELQILDVHGGTTEEDITSAFASATELLTTSSAKRVYVFLDEVNTCAHMGLIAEVIVSRSLYGKPIHNNIVVLAAANPYRMRKQVDSAPGLSYKPPTRTDVAVDPLENLVYRVHPIPKRLLEYVFDFGSLSESAEAKYIKAMVAVYVKDKEGQTAITEMLGRAQKYIRDVEGDPSVVSLRDLKRALRLSRWFVKFSGGKVQAGRHPWAAAAVLGIAHVFYFRLSSDEHRNKLLDSLRMGLNKIDGFEWLHQAGAMAKIIKATMTSMCSKLEVEDGIAMNQALKENLYVTLICIFNRIPIFVVGKPGSSKTLTLQVLANNLKGDQSTSPFWARFPALHIFPYQCSPLSTAAGIRHQFDIASSYQKKAEKTIVVLLLDEVGLAEHSPDMPLKVLHGILVDPPIAIVGLSNWTLDAAKMNRAICLQRPEPASNDIHLTGEFILGSVGEGMQRLLQQLSVAYHEVYTHQQGRDFVGMRDYYQTVKLLKRDRALLVPRACVVPRMQFLVNTDSRSTTYLTVADVNNGKVFLIEDEPMSVYDVEALITEDALVPYRILTDDRINELALLRDQLPYPPKDQDLIKEVLLRREKGGSRGPISMHLMSYSLMRNFGGSPSVVDTVCKAFGRHCFGSPTAFDECWLSPSSLIAANLNDKEARHLMVLTEHGAALPLLFDTGLIERDSTEVLVGSTFRDDSHELHLIQQVNKVKAAMASGKVVVLHNHDNIYESLYDVLNQRYVTRTVIESGKEKRMLRLAIGSRSQLCPVAPGFRIIVIAEAQHAYENLDLPLLNRFEKQVLNFRDSLTSEQEEKCDRLKEWVQTLCRETTIEEANSVFSGFIKSTLPSLVFSFPDEDLQQLQKRLAHMAMPIAVMQSTTLREVYPEYMEERSGMRALLKQTSSHDLLMFVTHSPVEQVRAHMTTTWATLRLSDMGSEYRLESFVSSYFNEGKQDMLLVQCDPMTTPQNTIDHAKRIVETCYVKWQKVRKEGERKQVLFLVHTPPGAKKCTRVFGIDFNKSWGAYFVDDITESDEYTTGLLYNSLSEMVEQNDLDVKAIVLNKLNTSLSLLQDPAGHSVPFSNRVQFVTELFERQQFVSLVLGILKRILKDKCVIGSTGLQHHVELALGELSAGSLKASLGHVVEYLLIQITAHILRAINVDFNLFTLTSESEELWYSLAQRVLDQDIIVDTAPIDGIPRASEVRNTGTVRVLKAEFPFSYRLIHLHEKAREPIMKQSSINYEGLGPMADQIHGTKITEGWNKWADGEHTAYLSDLVCTTARQFQGLEWKQTLALHTAVLKATNPAVLGNPLALHAAMWANEQRLFYLCSLLTCLKADKQSEIIKQLDETPHAEQPTVAANMVLAEMKVHVVNMAKVKKLADWAHRVYPSLMLDCKALGVEVGNWPLVADFIKLVVLQNHQLLPSVRYFVTCLFNLKHKVSALEEMFVNAPVQPDGPVKDAFLVPFLRDYALPAGDAVVEDVLRLTCGLRPKLYSGNGAASEPTRRSLFHTLVVHKGLEKVMKVASQLPMGPKYSEALAVLMLGYLEDMTVQDDCVTDEDLACLRDPKILSHDYLLAVARAKLDLHRYAVVLRDVCNEQAAIVVEEGHKRPLPKHSPQLSVNSRKLYELSDCGHFILGLLASEGGYNSLTEFLQIGRNYNWFVKFDRAYAESCSGDTVLPTIMPLVCSSRNQFTEVREAVRIALRGGAPAKQRATDFFESKDIAIDVKLCVLCDTMTEGALRKDFTGQEILNQWLLSLPASSLGLFLLKGGWGPLGKFGSNHFSWPTKALPMQLNSLYPLVCQVALLTPRVKGTYLELMTEDPGSLVKTYLPSMPISSEMAIIMQSMNEYVTWYKCPNGHLYSIGECGGPMEIGVCSHPGCRARIGGTGHTSLGGNIRLGGYQEVKKGLGSAMKGEPGYIADADVNVMRPASNLSVSSCAVLRIMMYSALLTAIMTNKSMEKLSKALQPKYIHKRLVSSYESLRASTKLKAADLLICCHVAIDRVGILLQNLSGPFRDIQAMVKYERAVEDVLAPLFQSPKGILESAYSIVGQGNNAELVNRVFSKEAVVRVFESKGLWKVRPVVSVAHFKTFFESNGHYTEQHPLLAAVCENEDKLCIIRYLADILEWHQILFKVLDGDDLTRIQAHEIPAAAVLARVPEADRPRARRALEGYCAVFNKAMPMLPNLHECQANPFLDAQGHVNLQGAAEGERVVLTTKAPISFSLPSMVPGEVDAPGLCTIQLSGLLHRAHNQVVEQLKDVLPEHGEVMIPTLSYETPPEVSRRLLISYDAQRDLIPLLYKYKTECDGYVGYDLEGIEKELMMTVFTGKMPLQLQMAHFEYYGEVRQRGGLAALANLDQAASLPSGVEESVVKEMNTQQQLSMLLRLVGDAINFVAAVGGVIKAETPLAAFLKDVMGMTEDEVAAKVPPAVVKYGKVLHLKALFLLAEGLMSGGGAFHRVNVKYTEGLDEECEMEVRRGAGHLRHSHLAGALRELIVGPLSGPDVTFPTTESLKDYVGYQDMDVGAADWFEKHFPEILQLRHAVATYELINKLAMKQ